MKTVKILIAALFIFSVQPAQAHDAICPAVWPCSDSGDILPEFDIEGDCGDTFRFQCLSTKVSYCSDDLSEAVNSLKETSLKLDKQTKRIKKLRKKQRLLKRLSK